jgi:hypothetical protein
MCPVSRNIRVEFSQQTFLISQFVSMPLMKKIQIRLVFTMDLPKTTTNLRRSKHGTLLTAGSLLNIWTNEKRALVAPSL